MKWTYDAITLFGIRLRIHSTFLLLLALIGAANWVRGGIGAGLIGVLLWAAVFACVVVHELAHSLTARHFGVVVRDITLYPIGGISRMERMPEKPIQEFTVSVVGPLTNVAIALLIFLFLPAGTGEEEVTLVSAAHFWRSLMWVNIMLAGFNLLPAYPMDGGRLLRAALSSRIGIQRATRIAVSVGHVMAIAMIVAGFLGNIWLAVIGIFIYLGATGEGEAVRSRGILKGIPARRAMVSNLLTVRPGDPLSALREILLRSYQADFPVLEGARYVGVVTKRSLIDALSRGGETATAGELARADLAEIGPETDLDEVYQLMMAGPASVLPVIENGLFRGLVTMENLSEIIMTSHRS